MTLSDAYRMLADQNRQLSDGEESLEACKEVLDALGPHLKYQNFPLVHLRMAEVGVFFITLMLKTYTKELWVIIDNC
jgi:hypothetical protein